MHAVQTVLFVDDDKMLLQSLKRSFRSFGCLWTGVYLTSAREALQWLEHNSCQLIVSDYMMQGMSGLTFLKQAASLTPDIPRFMMTGCADVSIAAAAVNDGRVTKFLIKPFDVSELANAINDILAAQTPEITSKISDDTAIPTLILTPEGRLLRANAQGHAFLDDYSALMVRESGLCLPRDKASRKSLLDTFQDAANDEEGKLRLLSLRGKKHNLIFLGIRRSTLDGAENALVVAITEPVQYGRPTVKNLQSALSLSYAEAVLAVELSNGKSLVDAGAECGLTRESARTYLKRIFEKTGTNKQADLVRLIYSTPVAFLQKETG